MLKRFSLLIFLSISMVGCSTISLFRSPKIELNIAEKYAPINSILIIFDEDVATLLPNIFIDSLGDSLENSFKEHDVDTKFIKIKSKEDLNSITDTIVEPYTDLMIIRLQQIMEDGEGIRYVTLNVTILNTQADSITMRANIRAYAADNLATLTFRAKTLSNLDEKVALSVTRHFILKMEELGLLQAELSVQ